MRKKYIPKVKRLKFLFFNELEACCVLRNSKVKKAKMEAENKEIYKEIKNESWIFSFFKNDIV
jgi:hypothetical protein